ncbi:hypothetical protein CROQUDRAFT_649648 [Cronartium quercuum f. sp. fusiforme G11]|uniref:polynucleotide adenylyltransferase n=1 Tax=Cronartium quercuum f. sp. fusiforme G11 TaxID=708437 RepID=A0A9P6NU39_9BASI|nr:hypothetical protein CROQUDRAFT_649648 [Cronartium quercuum f. sp. fusiforme G11]
MSHDPIRTKTILSNPIHPSTQNSPIEPDSLPTFHFANRPSRSGDKHRQTSEHSPSVDLGSLALAYSLPGVHEAPAREGLSVRSVVGPMDGLRSHSFPTTGLSQGFPPSAKVESPSSGSPIDSGFMESNTSHRHPLKPRALLPPKLVDFPSRPYPVQMIPVNHDAHFHPLGSHPVKACSPALDPPNLHSPTRPPAPFGPFQHTAPVSDITGALLGPSSAVSQSRASVTKTWKASPPRLVRKGALVTEKIPPKPILDLLKRVSALTPCAPDGTHDIGKEIEVYAYVSLPTNAVLVARQNTITSISRALNHSRLTQQKLLLAVTAFGSTTFGLDSDTSDLDLCILDPSLPNGPRSHAETDGKRIYSMRTLATLLKQLGFCQIIPVQNATVPIVKFRSVDGSIFGDINANHTLGVHNSDLLLAYHKLAPGVFRPLGIAIKLWAKERGICDPAGANGPPSISAYSLVLLLVAYLQRVGMLPNLQKGVPRRRTVFTLQRRQAHRKPKPAEEHDTSYLENAPEGWVPREVSITELFVGFFKYYASFDFASLVVSIRNGAPCERRRVSSAESSNVEEGLDSDENRKRNKKARSLGPVGEPAYYTWDEPIAVEDPFVRTRNTCKNVGRVVAMKIIAELGRAQGILERGGGLGELCELRAAEM